MAEVFEVVPGILCVRRRDYLTCSYVVRKADGIVLIDAGMNADGSDVLEGVAQLGASPQDVTTVLVTHWHQDHVAGLEAVKAITGATVYAHAREVPYLKGEAARRGLVGAVAKRIPEWSVLVLAKGLLGEALDRPVTPDALVDDGDVVAGMQVVSSPGHTPGHNCYFDPDHRALFAGDALAVIDGRVRFMSRPVTPDRPAARASMSKLLRLPIDIVCPGHREPLLDARPACERLLRDVDDASVKWPLFG